MVRKSEEARFWQIGEHVQATLKRRRWLRYLFAATGSCLLVIEAFRYTGPTDFRYVGLYVLYLAVPMSLFQLGLVAHGAWRRWREGWFKEQAEVEALQAAAVARGEDPDRVYDAYMAAKHPEEFELTAPASAPRPLSDAEMVQIHVDAAFKVEVFWGRRFTQRALVVATICAEEGYFFAPSALFGWPWWGLMLSALAWGFLHYPVKSGWACLATSGFGVLVGLTVLPHGILTNTLGHLLHDYMLFASHRFTEKVRGNLCLD